MRVGAEVELASPAVADVCVKLRGRQIGVPQHLLDAPQIGATLEQMRRERVPEQVRVDAARLEAGLVGEPPEHEEDTGARQSAALRVQEQLGPVAAVEVRPATREVAAECVGGRTAERNDPVLRSLAGRPHEPLVEIHVRLAETDYFAHSETGSVEQLDEGAVA